MEGITAPAVVETPAAAAAPVENTSSPEIGKMVDEISEGLFPAKPGQETPVKEEPKPAEAAAKTAEPAKPAEPTKPAGPAREAPKTFRPDAQAAFLNADPILQDEILKRENDIFKGIEGYKHHAAIGKSVQEVMKPYLPTLEKLGINPLDQISGMLKAHYTLSTGTAEQKQAMFQKIAQDYGVYVAPNNSGGADTYIDPQVSALQKDLAELKSLQTAREAREAEAQRSTLQKEIDTFASDPANRYFDEVANDIAQLLKAGSPTLKDAYDKAVWANPITRAKEQARIQTEAEEARKAEAKKKAEEARRATGANVNSKAKSGSATASTARLSSLDDVLAEGLAEIKARQ